MEEKTATRDGENMSGLLFGRRRKRNTKQRGGGGWMGVGWGLGVRSPGNVAFREEGDCQPTQTTGPKQKKQQQTNNKQTKQEHGNQQRKAR